MRFIGKSRCLVGPGSAIIVPAGKPVGYLRARPAIRKGQALPWLRRACGAVVLVALVIILRFPSREAIAEALGYDIRFARRAASKPVFDMVDGHVFHTGFAAEALPLPEGERVPRPVECRQ
jgi:hypothetical protein